MTGGGRLALSAGQAAGELDEGDPERCAWADRTALGVGLADERAAAGVRAQLRLTVTGDGFEHERMQAHSFTCPIVEGLAGSGVRPDGPGIANERRSLHATAAPRRTMAHGTRR